MLGAKQGDPIRAAAAWQLASDFGHADWPQGRGQRRVLRDELGDPIGAAAGYQLAIDSGHPDEAPTAAIKLGCARSRAA